VPFLFVYSPAILMKGSIVDIVLVTLTSLGGIWLICAAMTGYFTRVLPVAVRLGFIAAGVMLLLPHEVSRVFLWVNLAGLALGAGLIVSELKTGKTYARA